MSAYEDLRSDPTVKRLRWDDPVSEVPRAIECCVEAPGGILVTLQGRNHDLPPAGAALYWFRCYAPHWSSGWMDLKTPAPTVGEVATHGLRVLATDFGVAVEVARALSLDELAGAFHALFAGVE